MFGHTKRLQFDSKPDKPDAQYAMKFQEIIGGQFGEITVMMQYLWQGWNSVKMPGKYKDMLMDIATEEIGHVEMLCTVCARLLEGAPSEVTSKAVAANPALAAVIGGMNPQQAIVADGATMPTNSMGLPWNAGYIVASGNLLTDFRANANAEGQGRLQVSRLYNMTDDSGVKAMLKFNLARDTMHQNQWLAAIEQLQEDGLANVVQDALADEEDQTHNHTFWSFSDGEEAAQGRWAHGPTTDGATSSNTFPPPRRCPSATTSTRFRRPIPSCSPPTTAPKARATPATPPAPWPKAPKRRLQGQGRTHLADGGTCAPSGAHSSPRSTCSAPPCSGSTMRPGRCMRRSPLAGRLERIDHQPLAPSHSSL